MESFLGLTAPQPTRPLIIALRGSLRVVVGTSLVVAAAILAVWECELKDEVKLANRLAEFLDERNRG